MYARGMTVREIRGHLQELYSIEVSPDLISTVTDAVLEAVSEWQNRPLERLRASTLSSRRGVPQQGGDIALARPRSPPLRADRRGRVMQEPGREHPDGLKGFPEATGDCGSACIVHLVQASGRIGNMWPRRSGTYTGPRTPMPAWRRYACEAGPWGGKYARNSPPISVPSHQALFNCLHPLTPRSEPPRLRSGCACSRKG